MNLSEIIKVARGEKPADLLITNARIINVFTGEIVSESFAVSDGYIVGFGEYDAAETLDVRKHFVAPGFIDPHVHPSLPAVLTQFPFLAPDSWSLPTGDFPGATTPEAFEARLKVLAAAHADTGVPFIAWGYHPLWHGEIYRDTLNDWFPKQPVLLWHRSFHELIGNDAAFELLSNNQSLTSVAA